MTTNSTTAQEEMIVPTTKSIVEAVPDRDVKPEPDSDTADTAATLAVEVDPTSLPPSDVPDTPATRALWAALAAHTGATVADLALAAGISQSTAFKVLVALEKAGHASRHLGGLAGAKRAPDRWQAGPLTVKEPGATEQAITAPSEEVHDAESEAIVAAEMTPSTEDQAKRQPAAEEAGAADGKDRLGSGKLRDLVLGHLRDHAGEEFTPFVLGKALGRSSGAIANACDRLLADGAVSETSQKPRRFRFTG